MADDRIWGETTPEGAANDSTALSLALTGASRKTADAYLEDQRGHLHEQLKQIHLGIWEKQLGVALRLATMVMGLAVAGALAWLVWAASQSNGLLIEPFSVPPDLAERGLTGEVVAAKVLDRLTLMQSQTNTARPAKSYSNAWGEHGIKLEIPETGISLAELDSWLREKLGHDTRVTGEIVRTPAGVTITARAGDDGAESVSGPDADVDALAVRLAQSIYRLTQPYRYAAYLLRHENRPADALPIFRRLALTGSPDDRLWSYNMWGVAVTILEGSGKGLVMYRRAVAADPDAIGAYQNLAGGLAIIGRYEEALQTYRDMLTHLTNGRQRYVPADRIASFQRNWQPVMDGLTGAYHDALPVDEELVRTGVLGIPPQTLLGGLASDEAGAHDLSAARASAAGLPAGFRTAILNARIASAAEDWGQVLALKDTLAASLRQFPGDRLFAIAATAPRIVYAQARLGRFAEAEATIAPAPADCEPCLIARAQVAELRGQHARADFWFARAAREAPSFPFAFAEWGKALMQRRQFDDAIGKFAIANRKSPHFADPVEMWGEALMAENRSDLALEKFAEADKYAPNWGRLHLKWGEALGYAGRKDEAKAQFAIAAGLDLSAADKSELARMARG